MGGVKNLGFSKELQAWRQRIIWLRTQEMGGNLKSSVSSSSTEDKTGGSYESAEDGSSTGGSGRSKSIPDLSDAGLLASSRSWLPDHLAGVRTKGDMVKLDWGSILRSVMES